LARRFAPEGREHRVVESLFGRMLGYWTVMFLLVGNRTKWWKRLPEC